MLDSAEQATHRHDEKVNAATHAVGFFFGLAAAIMVVVTSARHGGTWEITACVIYAVTLLAAYAASTLSHLFHGPKKRHFFRITDQAVIFLFIAGSYTPIALAWLRGGPWWVLHGLIWGVALAGFASKAAFAHNVRMGAVSTALYLFLGWMPMMAVWPLINALPAGLMFWLVAGGACYTVGTIFFRLDQRIRHFHAAWHVMVLAGSACHFLGILFYCTAGPT
ncbi:MAG: hemolysin III family protein [Phycisphaeraceae bacterium]